MYKKVGVHSYRVASEVGAAVLFPILALPYIFYISLLLNVTSVSVPDFVGSAIYFAHGIILGIGEASLSSIGVQAIALVLWVVNRQRAIDLALASSRGWMRVFYDIKKSLRPKLAYLLMFLAVLTEEYFFRGLLLPLLIRYDIIVAVILSTALFMAVQTIGMQSLISSVPPLCGAFFMGFIHALYFITVGSVVPLVIAHIVYFAFFMSGRTSS